MHIAYIFNINKTCIANTTQVRYVYCNQEIHIKLFVKIRTGKENACQQLFFQVFMTQFD